MNDQPRKQLITADTGVNIGLVLALIGGIGMQWHEIERLRDSWQEHADATYVRKDVEDEKYRQIISRLDGLDQAIHDLREEVQREKDAK